MKTRIAILARAASAAGLTLTLALVGPLSAQDAKVPDIEILERVHDAGDVMKGETIEYTFKVKNDGQAPLQIFDVRPSCGCTVASFDKTVMPGEVGKIEATIDTNRVGSGSQVKTVTVRSNDPDEATIILQLKSNVITLASAIPPTVFLRTDRVNMEPTSFLIRPHEKNPFKIKAVTSTIDFLQFEVGSVGEEEASEGATPRGQRPRAGDYKVEVALAKDAPIGDLNGTITVMTDSKQTPQIQVPVRGSITGLITAIPRRVYLRINQSQDSLVASEDVKVRRDPSISSPEVGEVRKGQTVESLPEPPNVDPKDEWTRVRTPSRRVGYVYSRFLKKAEEGDGERPKESRTLQVRKNEGGPFRIRNVSANLDGVSVSTNTIEEGRSYSVTITYEGELGRGSHQGELEIRTTDKDEPTLKVPIYVHVT